MDIRRCEICGIKFYTKSGLQPRLCPDCRNIQRSIKRAGITYPAGRELDVELIKKKYRIRKQPCLRCGFSLAVVLHDIIPVIEGGNRKDIENRIPLCPNCHVTLHKNIWRIWEIEDKLANNPDYSTQYSLVQILKSENFRYRYRKTVSKRS